MQSNRKHQLLTLLIVVLAISRFLFPEADPAWWKSTDDIHDEAWWAENARRMILGEPWPGDVYARAWAVGPLTSLWHYIMFKAFGVHFFSLRLIALIPSSLSILLLTRIQLPSLSKERQLHAALLLAVLPLFWVMSRIGQIEALLSLLLLAIVLLSFNHRIGHWVLIGILMATGVLFKFSFVYSLPALGIWFVYRHISLRNLFTALGVFSLLIALAIGLYFFPRLEQLIFFLDYFKNDYYSSADLLDPRGWVLRLAWLPEKMTIASPIASLLISGILIHLGKGQIPARKTGLLVLLASCLFFLLFSDFSDRRLSVLTVLLPLVFLEDQSRPSSSRTQLILSLLFFQPLYVVVHPYFSNGNSLHGLLEGVPLFIGLLMIVLGIAYWLLRKSTSKASVMLFRSSIVFWVLVALHSSAQLLHEMSGYSYYLMFSASCILCGSYAFIQWRNSDSNPPASLIAAKLLSLISLGIILSVSIHPSYTLKEGNVWLAEHFPSTEGCGPETLVELCVEGKMKPQLYFMRKGILKPSYQWFAGITTPDADADSLEVLLNERFPMDTNSAELVRKEFPLYPSPRGFREKLIIAYRPQVLDSEK
jgi:4-amino-4-deoxy-L-arabinose transferase-like glycosyltransferase